MNKLPSLNGLRGISIIIVILFHISRFNILVDQEIISRIPIFNGRFGVNVFFVISGFLITSLLLAEEERAGSISLKHFYIRRTLRIFPAYFFLLFVYFMLQLLGYLHISGNSWLTALTYTKYLNYKDSFYTSHAWSLSIEENFYLFWPVVFMTGNRTRKEVTAYIILVVPLIRLYAYYYPIKWLDEQSLFTRLDCIAMGCYIALYKKEILHKLSGYWNPLFYGSLALLFTVPWLSRLVSHTFLQLFFVLFGELTGTIANLAIGIILMYSIYGPKNGWYALLNSRLLNYLGILSYSLYLWQQIFISKREWWVTHFPQNILLIYLSAIFSYYVVERPFLRLKSNFSGKKMIVKGTTTAKASTVQL
jgi:peptidoglycan/LPS O-acetylase OafA/YrhL